MAAREPFETSVDVLVEGQPLRRNATVRLADHTLRVDGFELRLEAVFWISRRAGMLLVFSREFTVAAKGAVQDLEELARAIEASVDQNEKRRDLLRPVAREVVVATAGTAADGSLRGVPIKGLFVAVFTQAGIHLFSRDRHVTLAWPATAARQKTGPGDARGGEVLKIESDDGSWLRLLYLFPEEINAVLKVAERALAEPPTDRPLEMFSRREVAHPPPADLPEFTASVGSLQEASERAAAEIGNDERARAGLGLHFFETHFMELGEIALGPLLLRKSAASDAPGLERAVAAMDAEDLRRDSRAAVAQAADRLLAVYELELNRVAGERRLPARAVRERVLGPRQKEELTAKLQLPFERMAPLFNTLRDRQEVVISRLEAVEDGPPGGEEGSLEAAADDWRDTLRRLDRAFEAAWRDLSGEFERVWEEQLLPRLGALATQERRRVPEWVQLALIGVFTMIVVAAIVFFVLL